MMSDTQDMANKVAQDRNTEKEKSVQKHFSFSSNKKEKIKTRCQMPQHNKDTNTGIN